MTWTKPSGQGNVRNPLDEEMYIWSNLVLSQSSGDTNYLEKIRMIIINMEKTCSYYNGAKTVHANHVATSSYQCRLPPSKAMLGLGLHVSMNDWGRPKNTGSLLNSYKYAPPPQVQTIPFPKLEST
ncbi:unnamed protein product [Microthlaspi erraticum]|uniref:Uncharacterized protein n=1 Tax=Microthlaspi erraticum TaxID=1685480 RepID=A0A6D2KFP1_9BRAS|nr:unnamed protein product [Microthlaspi erraticum]